MSILGKAKCGTKERDQKLQGDRADVGDVEVLTAFDVARPKQDAHGWITSALLRDLGSLEGQATFDTVESKFNFT